jgi:hypothetical protein
MDISSRYILLIGENSTGISGMWPIWLSMLDSWTSPREDNSFILAAVSDSAYEYLFKVRYRIHSFIGLLAIKRDI